MTQTAAQKAAAKKKRIQKLHRKLDGKQRGNRAAWRAAKAKAAKRRSKALRAIKRSGGTKASRRRSRNKIESRYNAARREAYKRFVRVRRKYAYPQKLHGRNTTDIFEHYDVHRMFSMDTSVGGINDVVAGQVPGSKSFNPEEYGEVLEEQYGNEEPVLNLGVTNLSSLITWEPVYGSTGVLSFTAHIEIPNSEAFSSVITNISKVVV